MSLASVLLLAWRLEHQVPEPPLPAEDVQWTAPPGCPDREALIAGITRRRGRALEPGQARVLARTIAVGARRYRLDLELTLGERREARVLNARTCAALVDAAALLIALAVDASPTLPTPVDPTLPFPASSPSSPAGEPSPITTTVPAPTPTVPPLGPTVPAPTPTVRDEPPLTPVASDELLARPLDEPPPRPPDAAIKTRRPGGFLRLHGLAEFGALPGTSGGLGLAGGLLWPRFRLELHATYLAPRTATTDLADVRAALFAGAALGCARVGRGALELPLCGGLELGGVPATAIGPELRASALGRWLAFTAALGVAWRVHPRIAPWAALQGLAAVQRPAFVLRDPGPERVLFDPGVLSARLALGVELRFGDRR